LRQALMPMHLRRSALSKKGHKGTAKTHRRTPPENVTEFCNTFDSKADPGKGVYEFTS
jgi:hypothetical protein